MGLYRKRFSFQPVVEEFAVGAIKQTADCGAQFAQPRRDLPVQPLLIIHRGQQTDRDHHECLVLRRP